ncbi:MAG TPA: nucleotidyltransferase domain-containing protein [Gemmatimonadaceae bacterium]|nr:nucleotidyltransferase domain-containing protein [Gemmatimonadaceae bacterium]
MAKMTPEELVQQLRAAYGPELRSVVLYGSAAAGEHIPKRSDYNILVLLETLSMDRLRAAAAVASAWGEAGNPAPMTLTTREWRGSADIFAMEYADILDRHKILYGEDPFDGIRVDPKDLRLQLEHEAMGKLLKLRQGVLITGGDSKRQIDLLSDSLSTIMVIFRAVLRLEGGVPAKDNIAVSQAVARHADFDATPFERVVRHVRGEQSIGANEVGNVIAGYLDGMGKLVEHLDRFAQ